MSQILTKKGTSVQDPPTARFPIAIGLSPAWKVSGCVGPDHWVPPVVGEPWPTRPDNEADRPAGKGRLWQIPA